MTYLSSNGRGETALLEGERADHEEVVGRLRPVRHLLLRESQASIELLRLAQGVEVTKDE